MRHLILTLALGLLLAGTALAETVTISAPWTQVRRTPSMDGRAIDIVYGNDTFTVLEAKDGWARITTARKVTGWVLLNDVDRQAGGTAPAKESAPETRQGASKADAAPSPSAPAPKSLEETTLSNASALAKLGYRDQAREKFTDLILRDPASVEAYESTRQMLAFYPVGYLPPLKGGAVSDEGKQALGPVLSAVLLQEAIALQPVNAARSGRIYTYLLDRAPSDGRAFLGLMDTLKSQMADALKAGRDADLNAAAASWRQHFPGTPLPDDVQKQVGRK